MHLCQTLQPDDGAARCEPVHAAEQAAAAERLNWLESRAVAKQWRSLPQFVNLKTAGKSHFLSLLLQYVSTGMS